MSWNGFWTFYKALGTAKSLGDLYRQISRIITENLIDIGVDIKETRSIITVTDPEISFSKQVNGNVQDVR